MCSGYITRYSCGHEDRAYYYICPDGVNEHYQQLLAHRLVGRRFRTTRLCRDCEQIRLDEEIFENDDRQTHEERAKALMEFFRGERPWPRPDDEVSENFARAYAAEERLHPWLNRGNEPSLERHRTLVRESFANDIDPEFHDAGARMFQIMLDRQADIDRTGRPITADDREFALRRLINRGSLFAVEVRVREQFRQDELSEWDQTFRNGEQVFRDEAPREARQDEVSESEQDIRQFFTGSVWAEVERTRENAGEMEQERYRILGLIRHMQMELDQFSEEITQELQARILNLDETREPEPVIQQQEAGQVEQQAGLYESDPEWLLNFDDWCRENSVGDSPYTETDLRRDLNGWFQHLRSCESQLRLDWIPFAESYRDAIQAGDRCRYEYSPEPGTELQSFRTWCIDNANPADIQVSSMNSVFINLLQGYEEHLRTNEWWADLDTFQLERQTRITTMRMRLARIPGAPLSRRPEDGLIQYEDNASVWDMGADIGRFCERGSSTTEIEYLQRQADIARLQSLQSEARRARDVRESCPAQFTIETEEREECAREEIEDVEETDIIDDDDDDDPHDNVLCDFDLFMASLGRQVYNTRETAAREEREERAREECEEQGQ
jgi:hypothetical protein